MLVPVDPLSDSTHLPLWTVMGMKPQTPAPALPDLWEGAARASCSLVGSTVPLKAVDIYTLPNVK